MKNFLLTIEYDGTAFHGWQRQPGKRTVQGELESALSSVCGRAIALQGVSRTDAGVHAYGQRAGFTEDISIPPDRLQLAANHLLCDRRAKNGRIGDLRILHAEEMPAGFHVRRAAVGKKYLYRILTAPTPDIFLRNACWQIDAPPDTAVMRAAAARLAGRHDFRAFQSAGGQKTVSTVRTIYGLTVHEEDWGRGRRMTSIECTGDGFLYNMVRILTGVLLRAGLGQLSLRETEAILLSCDRQNAGPAAPPQGLYLAEVYYDEEMLRTAAAARFRAPDKKGSQSEA
jgi:tRNA pseudouridine38-40 synthase